MIRLATAADAAGITEVHRTTYRAEYAAWIPEHIAFLESTDLVEQWQRQLLDNRARTTVCELDGAVAGYLFGTPPIPESLEPTDVPSTTFEIDSLYVRPDHHGAGVGRALVEEFLTAIAADGHRVCVLWALADHAASRGFYQHLGFSLDQTASKYWHGLRQVRYRRPVDR